METLGRLFGSEDRVKIMKLFLFNPNNSYSASEIKDRIKTKARRIAKELASVEKMGLVKKRLAKNKKGYVYTLNKDYVHHNSLKQFFLNIEPLQPKEILSKLNKLGAIKLVLVSGLFIQDNESRVDMLIVGDSIKVASLEKTMKILESEVGKELKYAHFSTEEFKYRLSMFDKLTRDILDYPHKKVLDKLGIL